MRSIPLLALLLCATACDEPDHWKVKSNPSGGQNGGQPGGAGGSGTNGGGTIVWSNGNWSGVAGGSSSSGSSAGSWSGGASSAGGGQLLVGPIVNAPVAPEAIYIACGGAASGVSVIDLNGFGQGTGDINNTRFPLNPNLGVPGVLPPLAPGVSNLDAGSRGALTLTQDVLGNTRLLAAALADASDLQIGQPLDLVFNNANVNPNAGPWNQINPLTGTPMPGNTITVAPHPNPPRLVLPPPNPSMGIEGEEPTVASTAGVRFPFSPTSPPSIPSPPNLLVPGDPFSSQPSSIGIFAAAFPGVFYGPQPPPPSPPPPPPFSPYVSRQQIGHFLYVLDRSNRRVVVVNSNRFTVLASIAMPDPVDIALSPNLRRLAVSNAQTGDIWLVDTDPGSASFHQVVAQVQVGRGVGPLAWQPEGEELLALVPSADELTLIDATTLQVRRRTRELRNPIALAVSARQTNFGFQTNTWFAFVLNGDGSVAVYESGPAGAAGIGYDDVLGPLPERFPDAAAIRIDHSLGAGFWIAHRDSGGLGQVSHVELTTSPAGPQPLLPVPNNGDATTLPFRGKQWSVTQRYGGTNPTTPVATQFSGIAIADLAFDDIQNQGALPDQRSPVQPQLTYALHSGKGLVKTAISGPVPARSPRLMFVACADTGSVDVIELATGARLATVLAPGVRALGDYWRQ